MLARRSVLAFLGLAPVAAPAVIAAAVRPEVLVAGVDVGAAGVELGVFAVTPGGLRAALFHDLRQTNFAELQSVDALFRAASIPPGRWPPHSFEEDA